MRRPLGCFTFSALVAAVFAVLIVLGATVASGHGIFSPGELSRVSQGAPIGGVASHADLAGRCEACHAAIGTAERMGTLCLACHTDVQQAIATKTGLHGRLDATTTNCRNCHTDHRGTTASLTLANPNVFPHAQTGYSLAAHQVASTSGSLSCRECHPDSPKTYTKPDCISCHQARDAVFMSSHQVAFGTACLNCHDGVETLGKSFSHASNASFQLSGAHASVQCASCHKGQTTVAALKTTPTDCAACHAAKDVHQGSLGTSCGNCHTSSTWTGASIDHNLTKLPLVGMHVGTACEACHVNRQWSGIGTTCASCHAKVDPHNGQFPGDCGSCHVATGWKDTSFNHAATAFALTGTHTTTSCTACHPGGLFKGTPTACVSCHAKPATHGAAMNGTCASCHTTTAWKPATFNHSTSAYPLTGAHLGVSCQNCHAGNVYQGTPTTCAACHARPATHGAALGGPCASCHTTKAWLPAAFNHGKAAFALTGAHMSVTCLKCHAGNVFKGTPTSCAACHTKPVSHDAGYGSACASCHTTKAWLPATFNHGKAAFPLTGAHLSVTCLKCHVGGVYKGTPTTCAACHTAPASHASGYGTACASCHTTKAWLPATFNHSKTAFPLTGFHASVACTKCHVGGVYKGTPTTCAACHTKPASHTSAYGTACAGCHTTTAWLPASYNGTHTFPMTHHGAGGVCATCHPAGPPAYSCAKCHSNSSMTSKHSGVSNFTTTTCASCHPKG